MRWRFFNSHDAVVAKDYNRLELLRTNIVLQIVKSKLP